MENFPDKISPMTLAAAIALGEGGGGQPSGEYLHYAGSITFSQLPALDVQKEGFVYDVTDGFTSTSDFTDGGGKVYPAGTNVAIVNRGTVETPVMKYDCMSGDFSNFVVKEPGKSLSTNDYTDADKTAVQNSPITVTAAGAEIMAITAQGNPNAITIYGKSEVVDGAIVSAGEGYAVVRLADLTWTSNVTGGFAANLADSPRGIISLICSKYPYDNSVQFFWDNFNNYDNKTLYRSSGQSICIKDTDYTTESDFIASLGDATIAYELADPTQGNCIAIKTDDGSGIDGTMATFSTGTPLRGIPNSDVRDVMAWDGSSGEVTKNCGEVDLGALKWNIYNGVFYTNIADMHAGDSYNNKRTIFCKIYTTPSVTPSSWIELPDKNMLINNVQGLFIKDTDYNDASAFKTAMSGVMLIYQLATPTTEQLTSTENISLAGLKTFTPTTHAQNNAGAVMTVEAYAGTANGQAVNELKQDVQSEISALKITQSATLTLTVADWSSNQQTVTYAHDAAKRNVIDVDPSSVEEWASCGILATAETATSITFSCKTVPENALTFRVTSMGV